MPADVVEILAASPEHSSEICLNEAESMLRVSTSHRISCRAEPACCRSSTRSCGVEPADGERDAFRTGGSAALPCSRRDGNPPAFERRRKDDGGFGSSHPFEGLQTPSNSSRCCVERVMTLQTKVSSPATEWTSQTSREIGECRDERVVVAVGAGEAADERDQLQAEALAVEQGR